ncbi:glutamine--fructose-6-phosphate transaminase (isomerizing) [Ostreibacterium oceani]|uniref:Glutamine--fructose-6-phosphate aminotransferase [isomerizing] n=1 Tax=Ostreibacterium oceani TaxID=2654998 RepID=A0A6N7ERS1_9GAMM|nr:glutamine--fructose-6-phosphate transaminase (isomerizing) [Ostreibacterium oceani]MPV85241.1 glutamine--fructose-6-phosphate transaminase (isomerizing) [Ostreibacterium oceani]
MCGIIGMVGARDVVPFLLDGLKRMEYRGYDSAGIAVRREREGSFEFSRRRAKGKIAALQNVIADAPVKGQIGIGHIRWATHGEPTEENAHPHNAQQVSVVHNGIIENWQPLKQELLNKGYAFQSQTDTEIIAKLIQHKLDQGLDAFHAFQESIKRLDGAYAIAVMIDDAPDTIFAARAGSPLVVGRGDNEMYVGSDALALALVTDKVQYLEEGDYAIITQQDIAIYDQSDSPVSRAVVETGLSADDTDKGGFPHFMLKEIHEQPTVIRTLIERYIDKSQYCVKPLPLSFDPNTIERMAFVACGTAYHAGLLGKYWMESLANLPVDVDIASEYRYRDLIQPKQGVFVAFSQSGETADTLAALRRAKSENQHIVSVVNVESSSMARESTDRLPTCAGAEIGVASTKAFIAQCVVALCLAIYVGRQRGTMDAATEHDIVTALLALPNQIENSIHHIEPIQQIAYAMAPANDVLFLGRGRHYPIALEAALKLKEISYIHAEGYAAGEMKHGAIALIDGHVPVVCLCPSDNLLEKSLSNMQEVMARKAQVVLVAEESVCQSNKTAHHIIIPSVHPVIAPILSVVPMQLLAYYTALALGKDVDQPRNLAKSVTVE